MAFLSPEKASQKCGSIGKAIPEGNLYLVDEDGNHIHEPDTEGELVYEGPNVTMGYAMCIEDLTKDDEFCGVYRTGDIAKMDEDGCLYIVGRKKRFLKLFGLRVSLDQSERIISDHFGIECACTGDDSKMKIYISKAELKDEVKKFISQKTGLLSSLFEVSCIEAIPRFESGKIKYDQLS